MEQNGVFFVVTFMLTMTGLTQAEQGKLAAGLSLPYSL
jgi:hypothetical protein